MSTQFGFIFFVFASFLIISCRNNSDKASTSTYTNFQMSFLNDWNQVSSDTINVELWYDGRNDLNAYLSQPRSVIEVGQDKFWVSDVMAGSILEFNDKGEFIKRIATRGKGPEEVIRPYAMTKYDGSKDTIIYVLDGDQRILMKFDNSGREIGRVVSSSVDYKAMIDIPHAIDENSILWQNSLHENFIVAEWDSLGEFKRGWIKRMTPLGTQPETINNVVYDLDEEGEEIVFSYKGLPLIFIKNKRNKEVINLDREENTINELIERILGRKGNEFNSVNTIIKGVSIDNRVVYVGKDNILLKIPLGKNNIVEKISLWNKGESIIFHFMIETDNYLFFIDGFNNRIYRIPIPIFPATVPN